MNSAPSTIGAVVIGRNEGQRLIDCLRSMQGQVARIVYVDSGSTDGSQQAACDLGAELVALDTDTPFTAARARNAGIEWLTGAGETPDFIQFVDGDCVLDPGWIPAATAFLSDHPDVAVVCGRRRERYPEASVFNRIIDREWDTPVGEARACGGDALMRTEALREVGGFNPGLIAGEEPELCLRLRAAGWRIWRINSEMTLHDAAITKVRQWWKRAKRTGHAYAEGAALHGRPPERYKVGETRRTVFRGLVLPACTVLALILWPPAGLALLMIWPLYVARLWLRYGDLPMALAMTFCTLAEGQGVLTYYWRRLTGERAQLIEYK